MTISKGQALGIRPNKSCCILAVADAAPTSTSPQQELLSRYSSRKQVLGEASFCSANHIKGRGKNHVRIHSRAPDSIENSHGKEISYLAGPLKAKHVICTSRNENAFLRNPRAQSATEKCRSNEPFVSKDTAVLSKWDLSASGDQTTQVNAVKSESDVAGPAQITTVAERIRSTEKAVFGCYDQLISRYGCCLDIVVKSMYRYPGTDAAMHEWACSALANWACTHDNRRLIAESNGFDVIIRAMKRYPKNARIQVQGCRAIGNLCCESLKNCELLTKLGGVDVSLDAMKDFNDLVVSSVHIKGCYALAMYFTNVSNGETIDENGSLEAIIVGMQSYYDDAEAQKAGCTALLSLSSKCDIASADLVKTIVNTSLPQHKSHSIVQKLSLSVLAECTSQAEHISLLIGLKGLAAIEMAMIKHSLHEGIFETGCAILWRINYFSDIFGITNKDGLIPLQEIASVEIITLFVNGLSTKGGDKCAIQEKLCALLATLAIQPSVADKVKSRDAIPAVVNLVAAKKCNVCLQRQACLCLMNLSFHKHLRSSIGNCGGISALVNAMRFHPMDEDTQIFALIALAKLLRSQENLETLNLEELRLIVQENQTGIYASRCQEVIKNTRQKISSSTAAQCVHSSKIDSTGNIHPPHSTSGDSWSQAQDVEKTASLTWCPASRRKQFLEYANISIKYPLLPSSLWAFTKESNT